ncbi:invasion associated locus B family protein [Oceanomicrobium pacificus]|uniref:Invasion associated locus B family protein n=1 Tax=Oceanomicrobium pacificus TaxID=2692916 RepID=A0A6B0TPN8_9RHOB|nr:invasion associated locus B family protein [Oceanomicrobium pacificus]MXU64619.1 hypothetical protein [Oceanomicrobium pacificus]
MTRSTRNPARSLFRTLVLAAGLGLGAGAVSAQDATQFNDWYAKKTGAPVECFIVSAPSSSTAKRNGSTVSVRRGDIRLYVVQRPGSNVTEVSFAAGYPLRQGSTVKIIIDDEEYSLYPDSSVDAEWAWGDPNREAALIAKMKAGITARVVGVSSRGTTTTDSFSLKGFTAAIENAANMCK